MNVRGFGIGVIATVTIGVTIGVGIGTTHPPPCCTTLPATLTSTLGNALSVTSTGNDADNRGIQIHQFATGLSAGGINVLCDGASTTTICALFSCLNGATCRAFESSDGTIRLHAGGASGTTTFKAAATFLGATFQWGDTTQNTTVSEGHLSSPTRQANCTSGAGSTITGNNNFITLVTGTTSTACQLNFAAPTFANPPTCNVVAATGSQQAGTTYTTTAGTLQITASPNSATYHITCVGH